MKRSHLLIAAAAVAAAAGCANPPARIERAPAFRDTGTPPATIALQREVRYYTDESGAIWDDRGTKQ